MTSSKEEKNYHPQGYLLLSEKIDGYARQLDSLNQKEGASLNILKWAIPLAFGLITLFIALQTIFTYTDSKKIDEELERAREKTDALVEKTRKDVEKLTKAQTPKEAYITDFEGKKEGQGEIQATINFFRDNTSYRASIRLGFQIVLVGGNNARAGRLLGFQYRGSGPLWPALYEFVEPEAAAVHLREVRSTQFASIGGANGRLAVENVPISAVVNYGANAAEKDCKRLLSAVQMAVAKSISAKLHVRPVFLSIENDPDENEFPIRLVLGRIGECPD